MGSRPVDKAKDKNDTGRVEDGDGENGLMHLYHMSQPEEDQVRTNGKTLLLLDYLITCTK